MADEPHGVDEDATRQQRIETGPAGRPAPTCPSCKIAMSFESGRQVHDLWSEHYVCDTCGRETFRSYGRGSV